MLPIETQSVPENNPGKIKQFWLEETEKCRIRKTERKTIQHLRKCEEIDKETRSHKGRGIDWILDI